MFDSFGAKVYFKHFEYKIACCGYLFLQPVVLRWLTGCSSSAKHIPHILYRIQVRISCCYIEAKLNRSLKKSDIIE
ncbi:hypothetical protein NPIL_234341 [Nephila pilipes]|uniref:Uncharacterized protein n=1 Tax=Nephila pilipes TaxID=299642 RepID=A0A8X6QHJ0_NEPPI|nr:hypothetical protein NPIL_234341 [Nephila pilipes]